MRLAIACLFLPSALVAQSVARVNVMPASPRVVAGDSLQLRAEAVDATGRAVPGVVIKFQQTAGQSEGSVNDKGLVSGGSVGTIPLVVTAVVGGEKPVITKLSVAVLPGPAASIAIEPQAVKLLAGQSYSLRARVLSKAGDTRGDVVTWTSSAPAVATVDRDGQDRRGRAGSATITAAGGAAKQTIAVNVTGTPSGFGQPHSVDAARAHRRRDSLSSVGERTPRARRSPA